MAKSKKKMTKAIVTSKKTVQRKPTNAKVLESINCLLELHKLQGVLLEQLKKDI